MTRLLSGTLAGLLILVCTSAVSAQPYVARSYGPSPYPPVVRYTPYVQPAYCAQPYVASSITYSSPSFGIGIYASPILGNGLSIYSGSSCQPYSSFNFNARYPHYHAHRGHLHLHR